MSKRDGALALPPCADPTSTQYQQHRWVQWGDDPRFNRCARCGAVSAQDISNDAKYWRERRPDRPIKHHHQFEVSRLDPRYEVCRCGKALPIEQPTVAEQIDLQLTCVVHVRRDAFDIYIGRRMTRYPELHAAGFGNPFTVKNLPRGYSSPIDAFRDWLFAKPGLVELYREQRSVMWTQLPMLRGKVLGCWCAPKGGIIGSLYGAECHGEVLAWLADHPEYVREHQGVTQARVGGDAA